MGEISLPSPSIVVMPRALMRPWSPLNLLATISSRYAVTAAMSMPPKVEVTPYLADSRVTSATSAECRSALVGMQPDVQAGAADLVLLDQTDGQAELARAQRGGVPTASAAKNDKVKSLLSQSRQLLV